MARISMLVAAAVVCFCAATANAQVSQVVYYGAAPVVVAPQPTTAYYAAPTTTFYAPAATTAYYAPAPVTTFAQPVAVPVTATRYRPLIGGTITRTRYVYPAVTYGAPAVTYYQPY
jgi:hypothetical protein